MASTSALDLWETVAAAAAAESPLWGEALRADPEHEPVFSPLAPERYALGLETIYEGYLLHYAVPQGRSRLFAPPAADVALLLGDYLYAHGLVHIAATESVEAVAELADLISTCAALQADGGAGDGEAWVAAARRLGGSPTPAAVERALAAHAARVG